MPQPPADRRIETPRARISRSFNLALAGALALVLSAMLLAPGLANPDHGHVCAAPLFGPPQDCAPYN
jgi:hypothetical protein